MDAYSEETARMIEELKSRQPFPPQQPSVKLPSSINEGTIIKFGMVLGLIIIGYLLIRSSEHYYAEKRK